MTCPDFCTIMFLDALNSGLFASFTICVIANLANALVLKGMGLNLGFLLLVTAPVDISEIANHILNLLLLMPLFVKL